MKLRLVDNLNYNCSDFDCGIPEINQYLISEAIKDQEQLLASTKLLIGNTDDELEYVVGYYTLTTDKIEIEPEIAKEYKLDITEWSAIKIARIGVDVKYQRQGVGTYLLKQVIAKIFRMSRDCGIRFITLDAYKTLLDWYINRGFIPNQQIIEGDKIVSLRFDLLDLKLILEGK